ERRLRAGEERVRKDVRYDAHADARGSAQLEGVVARVEEAVEVNLRVLVDGSAVVVTVDPQERDTVAGAVDVELVRVDRDPSVFVKPAMFEHQVPVGQVAAPG